MVAKLKAERSEIAIGADIIAGFPTETDAMAENTLALIDDCQIVYGHIFPYSARRGTPAAKMPQVPVPMRKERAQKLRDAAARQKAAFLESLVGTRQQVLIERNDGRGHAENFAEVAIRALPGDGDMTGKIVRAEIVETRDGILIGDIA